LWNVKSNHGALPIPSDSHSLNCPGGSIGRTLWSISNLTLVRWHRKAFRLFWRWKSRSRGRPRIPHQLRLLIIEIATQNRTWGEERIADELLLKIGIRISPRTVRRHMPRAPQHPADPKQRWMTFVRNHAKAIIATDFFVVVTASFQLVYIFVVIEVATGGSFILMPRDIRLPIGRYKNAELSIFVAMSGMHRWGEGYQYIIHDRDRIYSGDLDAALTTLGLTVLKTPPKSPKANAICERWIGSARRECLDFMIPLNESHIRMILKPWIMHFNRGRPHSSLGPGIPEPSVPKIPLQGKRHRILDGHRVSAIPLLGGLHHEYKLEKIAA
jgi:putative transposase